MLKIKASERGGGCVRYHASTRISIGLGYAILMWGAVELESLMRKRLLRKTLLYHPVETRFPLSQPLETMAVKSARIHDDC